MTRDEFLRDYWAYYLMLEDRFIHTIMYVELSEENFNTFSNEYAGLLQIIGAEIDSFFKVFCGFGQSDTKNIKDYAEYIFSEEPDVISQEIVICHADLTVEPFEGWERDRPKQTLFWWQVYDNIKHGRAENKRNASQKCVLYALSALFTLETMYISRITYGTRQPDIPDTASNIFKLKHWRTRCTSIQEIYLSDE